MNIRQKTLTTLGITFLILLFVLSVSSRVVILGGFKKLEEEAIHVNISRHLDEFSSALDNLNIIAGDWSSWDDTYEFVHDLNADYIQANLVDSTFSTLNINFMLFFDTTKTAIYTKYVDLSSGKTQALPAQLLQAIRQDASLMNHRTAQSYKQGILLIDSEPVYVASRPILKSDFSGDSRGTFVIGRYIDETELRRISAVTDMKLNIHPFPETEPSPEFQALLSLFSDTSAFSDTSPNIRCKIIDADTIAGYGIQNDLHGKPAFIIRLTAQRKISHYGQTTLLYYILSLLTIGLVFIMLVTRGLDRLVLSPLSVLSNRVAAIDKSGDFSRQLPRMKHDEFKKLAETINLMLRHLAETHENLEIANRVKSDFLSIISHELRTPLVPIIANTEWILFENEDLDEYQQECLRDVLKHGMDLQHLINDILDLSSIEAGEMQLNASEVQIAHLLQQSLHPFRDKARKHNLSLSITTENLPETIYADKRKLKQVLYKLLSNAVKFSPDGGTIRLTARMLPAEERNKIFPEKESEAALLDISVQDTGIGLEKSQLARIFRPFEQLENPLTRNYGGAGLGLSLAKKIVELHQGKIWAKSDGKGTGTTIHVVLPLST